MAKLKSNVEKIIEGLNKLLGIDINRLNKFAEHNDILKVLDHPMMIEASDDVLENIKVLKDFINSYNYLRDFVDEKEITFNSVDALGKYFTSHLAFSTEKEVFLIAYMNNRNQIMSCEIAFEGTIDACYIHLREVIKRAIQLDCPNIAVAHNHPSGKVVPSQQDKLLTTRLTHALSLVDIKFIDHFIVGGSDYISFREIGLLNNENIYSQNKQLSRDASFEDSEAEEYELER